ncbi:MAG: TetR family transcriptional regulator [Actinomycetota bacterium]|nr:TetR family transcriptional regulator [Actinomycetota bacterium]
MAYSDKKKLLRIGEISKQTGVSTSAINFYIREGLLPPPLKTAPNMAYYDPVYITMINSIKILKREKGLKLSKIRELLAKDEFWLFEEISQGDPTGKSVVLPDGKRQLDRRKHVMDVASKVFAEKGYYSTTISDLAQAAGIAKGTFYWHFENKRSIMFAILEDLFHEIDETFSKVIRRAGNGLEAIIGCVEPAIELLEKHGSIYLMYFMEIGSSDPILQEKFREIYKAVHRGTKRAIERGIEQGVIAEVNPDIAAYAIMGMVERGSQVGTPDEKAIPLEVKAKDIKILLRKALEGVASADPSTAKRRKRTKGEGER